MTWLLRRGWIRCRCAEQHRTRLVAITGGPGAGKTALLDALRRSLCEHVLVLPEAARIVLGGGFPRLRGDAARRAAQRAIYRVQSELEAIAIEHDRVAVALCDRGRIDGLAYWPDSADAFFAELGTTRPHELERYAAVVHLRPAPPHDYASDDPVRVESADEARQVDARIEQAWAGHATRTFIEATSTFAAKLAASIEAVRAVLPSCCRAHVGFGSLAGDLRCEPIE